jgi:hypothetical protein
LWIALVCFVLLRLNYRPSAPFHADADKMRH